MSFVLAQGFGVIMTGIAVAIGGLIINLVLAALRRALVSSPDVEAAGQNQAGESAPALLALEHALE
jgi:hypothetical protein